MKRHGQSVVPAGGAARPYTQPYPKPHKQGAEQGGGQRMAGDFRVYRGKQFKQPVPQGEASAGDDRQADEAAAQNAPAEQIAQSVEYKGAESRRQAQPMVQQQGKPQYAALGNSGKGMDIIKAKGQNTAACDRKEDISAPWPVKGGENAG